MTVIKLNAYNYTEEYDIIFVTTHLNKVKVIQH